MWTEAKTKDDKILTTIPFTGFYESWHSAMIDDAVEGTFDHDGTGVPHPDYVDAWWEVNYQAVYQTYARWYTEQLGNELDIPSLEFESLSSPREYNFTTDRIFAWIGRQDLTRLLLQISLRDLQLKVHERFTSRDGFTSWYENSLAHWPRCVGEWDHNQIGTILEVVCDSESYSGEWGSEDEFNIMEPVRDNGYIEDLIHRTSPSFTALSNKYFDEYVRA